MKKILITGHVGYIGSHLMKELNATGLDIKEGNLSLIGTIVLAPADIDYTQIAWRCQLKKLNDSNPVKRYQAYFLKNYFDTTIEDSIVSLQSIFNAK